MIDITSIKYFVYLILFIVVFYSFKSTIVRYYIILTYSFIYLLFIDYQLALLILFFILVFFLFGRLLINFRNYKRLIFISSIALSIFILYTFKYSNFIYNNSYLYISPVISLGMSYYLFTGISYLIEIYNDRLLPEDSIIKFASYISFFPKFTSGPIEKPNNFFKHLVSHNILTYEDLRIGFFTIFIGLFKKLVISNRIAPIVDFIFDNPSQSTGLAFLLGGLLYAFQLYCDFSGYTDIVLGISKIIGLKLTDNFNKPYLSKSIQEFWTRWHISLSTWARDYIFLPTAYFITRRNKFLSSINLKTENIAYILGSFFTMLIIGIWHGPKWTFVIWGLMHVFYLIFGFLTKRLRKQLRKKYLFAKSKVYKLIVILYIFSLVTLSWIVFRANSITDLSKIFIKLLSITKNEFWYINVSGFYSDLLLSVIFICLLMFFEIISNKLSVINYIIQKKSYIRWLLYYTMLLIFILYGVFGKSDFIYFNF